MNIFPGPNPWDPHANLKEFRSEAAAAPSYLPLGPNTDAATVDAKLAELERALTAKRDHAAGMANGAGATSDRRRFFEELQAAMQNDVGHLQGRSNLSREGKIELYNRIAHEARIEIKYNVDVRGFNKEWSDAELGQMEGALAQLPDSLVLENKKLALIYRFTEEAGGHSGQHDPVSGTIGIYDDAFSGLSQYPGAAARGISSFEETLIHEVGHSLDDEGPRWAEYMRLSGWHKVDRAAVANVPNGSAVKGADVGITEDPNGIYIVAKENGDAFVYKQGAAFGKSNYGRSNPYDDFCETLAEFSLDPEKLKMEAPEKYAFMSSLGSPGYVRLPFPKLEALLAGGDGFLLRG
jgi:hypothetical protein